MKVYKFWVLLVLILPLSQCKKTEAPKPLLPLPTSSQIQWNEMERNAFIHFGLNTFNDMEWGFGDTPAATFNPSELDVNQWCEVIKKAGLKGIILTAKHHDGFCLWPSKYTEYSVKNSPWRNGKGDLVKELSDACKKHGLKFGIYLSPWDRNSAIYGSPEYLEYFHQQLTELLTNYGDIFEVWFDGANGGTGYYGGSNDNRSVDRKTYYDWPITNALVYKLQPNALIFSDAGPDIRWCGNEHGEGGRSNWSTLRRDEAWPGWPRYQELNPGHEDGDYWVPAEINTSVRPGWFYHKSEDHQVKTVARLMDYYYESVGRNGTALLNFPIDHRGLIHETDAANVIEWQQTIEKELAYNLLAEVKDIHASNTRGNSSTYSPEKVNDQESSSYWACDDDIVSASLVFEFETPITFNRFLVQEYIALGQRVKAFSLEIMTEDAQWKEIASESTIGYKRILRLPNLVTKKIRFTILDAKACPTISNVEIYNAPQLIISPAVTRNKEGLITIISPNKALEIYYTLDGTTPFSNSVKYRKPIATEGKVNLKAMAYDSISKKQSDIVNEEYDIDRYKWSVLNMEDKQANQILDGNIYSISHQSSDHMPIDLILDLGEVLNIKGFKYLPDQGRFASGIISHFEFYTSKDGKKWQKQSYGEFSNIKNHPVWQKKIFNPVMAQYVKLRAISNTKGDQKAGYAEFDIITE